MQFWLSLAYAYKGLHWLESHRVAPALLQLRQWGSQAIIQNDSNNCVKRHIIMNGKRINTGTTASSCADIKCHLWNIQAVTAWHIRTIRNSNNDNGLFQLLILASRKSSDGAKKLIYLTRKVGSRRAQRVGCSPPGIHIVGLRISYLPKDWLLPPSEWPLTSTVHILASRQLLPMQMHLNISGVTASKFTKFVAIVIFFIDGVNAIIRVAIRPPVIKWEGDI